MSDDLTTPQQYKILHILHEALRNGLDGIDEPRLVSTDNDWMFGFREGMVIGTANSIAIVGAVIYGVDQPPLVGTVKDARNLLALWDGAADAVKATEDVPKDES